MKMIFDKLKEHSKSNIYPMHMPGHKRNSNLLKVDLPYDIDLTEIYGFDDLKDPQGILLETSRLASSLYSSIQSFLLINGSTVGILAGIGAHTNRGDSILAAEGCHWSVPNAAKLFGLKIKYVTPNTDLPSGVTISVSPEIINQALSKDKSIKLVVITSPSYEGVVSDIRGIADVVHKHNALLFIDSAHGAHLGFSEFFPESHTKLDADLVVMSLHKTLPALTQCSLLHVCSDKADAKKISEMLYILQTSSPSYVLLASIDYCLRLLEEKSQILFADYKSKLLMFYDNVSNLKNLSVLTKNDPNFYTLDPGKIIIYRGQYDSAVTNMPGATKSYIPLFCGIELISTLRSKYQIELEKAVETHAIAMTSFCDTDEGLNRLADALIEIDMNW